MTKLAQCMHTGPQDFPAGLAAHVGNRINAFLMVADAWSFRDDWGVQSIHTDTLRDIAKALGHGDDARMLARHAQHMGSDCASARCRDRIPFTWNAEEERMEALKRKHGPLA